MKKITSFIFIAFAINLSFAQVLVQLPSGGNKKAIAGEQIGITKVLVHYDRPGVKGREGKVYGPVVHKGFEDLGYGTSKASPWRAGANENTIIEFSTPVKINGQDLPAGKYGFFIAYDPNECIAIFNKNTTSWGSYFYSDKEDALRIKIKPVALDKSVEWLTYEFLDQTDNSAVIAMQWEKLSIPFKVEVDLVKTRIENYQLALRGEDGFRWENCNEAAALCLDNNTNLEDGLRWSREAVNMDENFMTLSTHSGLLAKNGKDKQADSVMKVALDKGTKYELHGYGRKLVFQKKPKQALEVYQLNAKKHPKDFLTYAGLARGYSANADYKTALANAKLALPLAPDDTNKKSVQTFIEKLEKGQDIN